MEKIMKINYVGINLKGNLKVDWTPKGGMPPLMMPIDVVESCYGKEVSEEIKKFYENPLNKNKSYNLILVTNEELNKLEKISKKK